MRYLITKGDTKVLSTYASRDEAFLEIGKWLQILDFLDVSGIQIIVWKEWATGKRQKIKSFFTQPKEEYDEKLLL